MKDLAGKVAVVTGGGSGIGSGMAEAFAEAGMEVVVVDIDEERAKKVAGGLASRTQTLGVGVDVTDFDAVKALADRVVSEFGAVDVLCNNAGVMLSGPWLSMKPQDWRWTFEVNVIGVVNGVYAFLPHMLERGAGHIVNTASMASFSGGANHSVYTASKHACSVITESLRAEMADKGIGVSGLYPGGVMTDIVNSQRSRQERFGAPMDFSMPSMPKSVEEAVGDAEKAAAMAAMMGDIQQPIQVGRLVRQAIQDNEPWIFTHPHWFKDDRWDEIHDAAERAKAKAAASA